MENNSGSECYTFEEVRKMLVLSPSRCNDLFNKRTIGSQDFPGFKIGRTWRVRKDAYDSWIEEQEEKPIPKKMARKKKDGEESAQQLAEDLAQELSNYSKESKI